VDGSDPIYSESHPTLGANPTNGSWWMVQILSNKQPSASLVIVFANQEGTALAILFCPPARYARSFERTWSHRKDLNYPPTAVGGIRPLKVTYFL